MYIVYTCTYPCTVCVNVCVHVYTCICRWVWLTEAIAFLNCWSAAKESSRNLLYVSLRSSRAWMNAPALRPGASPIPPSSVTMLRPTCTCTLYMTISVQFVHLYIHVYSVYVHCTCTQLSCTCTVYMYTVHVHSSAVHVYTCTC